MEQQCDYSSRGSLKLRGEILYIANTLKFIMYKM